MRRLTLKEVNEQYEGKLPPDAILRPDDDEEAAAPVLTFKSKRYARSGRFAALNDFVDFTLDGLTGAEVKVWLILFRDTKANGLARTGQTDIARRAGLSVRGVQKIISRLEAKGLVQLVRRGRLNAGPSSYRVISTST